MWNNTVDVAWIRYVEVASIRVNHLGLQYKRIEVLGQRAPELVDAAVSGLVDCRRLRRYGVPVSYTHLDVYKRQIKGLLTLTSVAPPPDGPTIGPVELPFTVSFLETPNAGTGGFCADGAAVGSGGVNINGCADIFVIDVESLNFPFPYDSDGAGEGDPRLYFLSIFANDFGTLSNACLLYTSRCV